MPKVDRIIMALTANAKYVGYWNYVSQLWAEKFSVVPTLIFYGTEQEYKSCHLRGSEIVRLNRIPEVTLNQDRDWACTWGLFYGASLFPNDICMLCGIDQIPLSGIFFDALRCLPNWDKYYVVGFGDAYSGSYFPSSHHVAHGQQFRTIYGIEASWEAEVKKVFATRHSYPKHVHEDAWGLDETYSSERLLAQKSKVLLMNLFWRMWHPRRIDRVNPTPADMERIRQGHFSEWHGLRPFESNNPATLARIYEAIPRYVW